MASNVELRPIPGWPMYSAGSDGGIYSHYRPDAPRRLRPGYSGKGYEQVNLCGVGKPRSTLVHTLILLAFCGPRPDGMTGSHLNGDKLDNRPSNLIWELHADNLARKDQHGTRDRGLKNTRSVMTSERLAVVRQLIAGGATNKAIAAQLHVSATSISRIRSGKRYAA